MSKKFWGVVGRDFGTALVWINPNYFGSLCSNPNKIQTNDMVGGVMYFCHCSLRGEEELFHVWWVLIIHIHVCAKVLSYFDGFPFVCFQNFLMFLRRPQGLVGSHAIKLFLHQSPIPPPGHLVRCPSPNKMKSFYLKVLWIFLSSPPIQDEIFLSQSSLNILNFCYSGSNLVVEEGDDQQVTMSQKEILYQSPWKA